MYQMATTFSTVSHSSKIGSQIGNCSRRLWRNLSSRCEYQQSCSTFNDQFQWQGLDVKELQEGHFAYIIADDHAALEAIVKFYQQHDGDGKVKDRDIYGRR